VVDVDGEAHALAVERLGPVDVADREEQQFEAEVHVRSPISVRWRGPPSQVRRRRGHRLIGAAVR
jgi:hypothetical protein